MRRIAVRTGRRCAHFAVLAMSVPLVLAACASTEPRVVTDSAASAPQCQAVAWAASDERPVSMADQQVRDLLLETMQRKGYRVDADSPDCLLYHRFGAAHSAPRSGPSVGLGVGGGSSRVGGGLGLSFPVGGGSRTITQLVVDVVDAARNEQVWGGRVEMTLAGEQPSRAELSDSVARLLYQFPDRR